MTQTIRNPDLALAGNAAANALAALQAGDMDAATGLAIGMNAATLVNAVKVDMAGRIGARPGLSIASDKAA